LFDVRFENGSLGLHRMRPNRIVDRTGAIRIVQSPFGQPARLGTTSTRRKNPTLLESRRPFRGRQARIAIRIKMHAVAIGQLVESILPKKFD
jgi:hypothetical protein